MKHRVRAWFEGALLRIAASIVLGRNVRRASVVSRKDNNYLFEVGFELNAIAGRIESGYSEASDTSAQAQQRG